MPLKPLERTAFFHPFYWVSETWADPRSKGFVSLNGFGDFQGRCHSLAATQATLINGSASIGSGTSVGLLIHTSSGDAKAGAPASAGAAEWVIASP